MELAIVGLGKLGLALLEGLLSRSVLGAADLGVIEVRPEREPLAERLGVRLIKPAQLREYRRTLICVQPRLFPEITEWLACEEMGYISSMAGVPLSSLVRRLGTKRVVRVMPNLGATIGQAQTALAAPPEAEQAGDVAFAEALFRSVGDVYPLPEHLLDTFTGMSASAPAYLALVAEALADGGVRMGLARPLSQELAAKALITAGQLLLQRTHPGLLKDEVASPGGTTIAGLEVLEQASVRGAFIGAVVAASRRGRELGGDD